MLAVGSASSEAIVRQEMCGRLENAQAILARFSWLVTLAFISTFIFDHRAMT